MVALGKGTAVLPSQGVIKAPADGVVRSILDSGSAIGFTTDSGLRLLIRIGLNTSHVEDGRIRTLIEKGERVRLGDTLVEFDLDALKEEEYNMTVPVIITNSDLFTDIIASDKDTVRACGDVLFKFVR
jgi:PTS system beta-glucosides-specific IIC component